ncbi:hypothetical protein BDD12DRAFT_353684 [Trichophaea hybrida]|nr:hypothetical protein BDD12DRAFT_353684 [Trichophaea hybrida]
MTASAKIHSLVQDTLADNQFEIFSDPREEISRQHRRQFSFGIFLAAEFRKTGSEVSALLVHLPFLGLGAERPNSQDDESWNLFQYLKSKNLIGGNGNDLGLSQVSVHQALFTSFNEDFIIMARSKGVGNITRNIFPQQDRVGAFHLLVNMIAETLRFDDRKILKKLGSKAAAYDFEDTIDQESSSDDSAVKKDLILIKAVKLVTENQIETLRDLKDLFQRAGPDHITPSVYSSKYNANMMSIPVISGNVQRTDEQLHYVVSSLGKTIEERQGFNKELSSFIKKIEKSRDGRSTDSLKSTLDAKLSEQRDQTKALQDEIASQGKTISIFTVLNVVFLPLSFFTQYFSSTNNQKRNGVIDDSLGLFWAVTGPITGVIVFVAFVYFSKSKYNWRQYIRFMQDWLFRKGDRRPHLIQSKSDILDQRLYLKRLPKYKIKAVSNSPESNMYLKKPDFSKNDPMLTFTDSSTDIFCFDQENGWLLYPIVDRYNYMYRAHAKHIFPHSTPKMKVSWKRSPTVTEEAPYRFMGRFKITPTAGDGRVVMGLDWEFSGCDERSATRRWDTNKIKLAGDFEFSQRDTVQELILAGDFEVSQRDTVQELMIVNPWDNSAGSQNVYKLFMIPVSPGEEVE